jgi:mRNA interferase RelE/StbE
VYRLVIKRPAERDLRRLPQPLFRRINQAILALADDPRPSGTRQLKGALDGWRLRVGHYRIVFQVDDTARIVTIIRVRHRRDVYGP